MPNHPNRSRAANRASNPTPDEILGTRFSARLTQQQAADLVYTTAKTWRNWEADESSPSHRRMHPAIFELFLLKTGQSQLVIDPVADET